MKKIRRAESFILALVLVLTSVSLTEATKAEAITEAQEKLADDASGDGLVASEGKVISNPYFSVTLPSDWEGKYIVSDGDLAGVSFSSKMVCDEVGTENGGWLFSIVAYMDDSLVDFPDTEVLKRSGGQIIVLIDSGGAEQQTIGASEAAKEEYLALFADKKAVVDTLKIVTEPPTKPTVKSVKNTKGKKAKVTLKKKVSGAKGYEIQYSTSKKFKTYESKTTTKTAYTITKLTKKKTYYVRVRSYKTVKGANVYSAWSTVKSVKVKK